jgi:hypothetical protein
MVKINLIIKINVRIETISGIVFLVKVIILTIIKYFHRFDGNK